MSDTPSSPRWTLYDLPMAAKLTVATFLISVGIGYFSALVQLHFQHAKPGSAFPGPEDAENVYTVDRGAPPVSTIERLITADESKPFNGTGQMRSAFFRNSDGWKDELRARAMAKTGKKKPKDLTQAELDEAEKSLRREREAEIEAVLAWISAGFPESAHKANKFTLPADKADIPIKEFVKRDADGTHIEIKELLAARCTRCHMEGAEAEKFPLEHHVHFKKYLVVKSDGGGMSFNKLAQTTHVHLLGFSMLYGLTGLILALTPLPGWIRLPLAPLPLLAQVVDISFWWLARMDQPHGPMFARWIVITGMIVAGSLGLQIILTLFSLFGRVGQLIVVLLIGGFAFGGFKLYEKVINPFLEREAAAVKAANGKENGKDANKDNKKDKEEKKDER
jgi:hypothetical protein